MLGTVKRMSRTPIRRALSVALAPFAFALCAQAAPIAQSPAQGQDEGWNWRIAPYLWATDIDGTLGGPLVDVELDVEFGDILDNLGGAWLVLLEADRGQVAVLSDFVFLSLDLEGDGPGNVTADIEFDTFIYDLAVLYAMAPGSAFELGGGLRYASFENELAVGPLTGEIDRDVLDGVLAARARWPVGESFALSLYGDIGGGDSDLTWQANAMLGWQSGAWGLGAGYRAIGYDIEEGGDELDLTLHGLFFGLDFRF